jgi:CSLREA domain-containing protein
LKLFASVLLVVGCLLVMPAAALAATYTVDSTADEPDATPGTAGCLTAGLKCTLRAAIQESNFSIGVPDEIKFAAAFDGQPADTIVPATALPAIKDPVSILGGDCFGEDGPHSPCAGVEGPSGASALTVENANGVVIEGLSVTGAQTGINVIDSSEEFVARNDWVGIKLGGGNGGNTTGVFLDPDSDRAGIGGVEPKERNLFGYNAGDGLDVLGADSVEVLGNYFGVVPDASVIEPGGSTAASNGKDIEVNSTSVGGFEAEAAVIGANLSPAAAASPECDGGCNVISGATLSGIDLQGDGGQEAPAGAVTIEGNHVGLNAAGTAAIANGSQGVLVGSAHQIVVARNHINGGSYGIFAGAGGNGADDLLVDENMIGLNPAGTETLAPPGGVAIIVDSAGLSGFEDSAEITDNRISMVGGEAIQQHGQGALISGNSIGRGSEGENLSGGTTGIRLYGSTINGNTIEANVIENSEGNGVLIENENNLLTGNVVEGAGLAGIRIKGFGIGVPATGNTIGGDEESEENAISDSGGDAIEIVGEEDTDNQVRRNFGDKNGGLFIDLGANGSGNGVSGPNAGIQAPKIDSAKLTGASGSGALAGATIRVFRKATASPGELHSFLGEAVADGSGNWSMTYAAIPGETQIAASQTGFEGTSELAFAKTEPAPKTGGEGTCPSSGDPACKATKDKTPTPKKSKKPHKPKVTALETTITRGPRGRIHSTTVRFKFVASEPGAKFECKLDRSKFKPCKSPKKYKGLKPGKHVFKVRAVKGKVADPTPAKRRFKILR